MQTTEPHDTPLESDKPEIEVIDGVGISKVSPKRRHATLQAALVHRLIPWAGTERVVGTEWRFRLNEAPGAVTTLIPDIAVVSASRLRAVAEDDIEEPPFAPDVAIEIRSPSTRAQTVATKIERYLQFGAALILDIDPMARTIRAHDTGDSTLFRDGNIFEHAAVPGLRFDTAEYFAAGDFRR